MIGIEGVGHDVCSALSMFALLMGEFDLLTGHGIYEEGDSRLASYANEHRSSQSMGLGARERYFDLTMVLSAVRIVGYFLLHRSDTMRIVSPVDCIREIRYSTYCFNF